MALIGLLLLLQDTRQPPPDAAAQKKAETLIREVFKEDYAKTSFKDRGALLRKLMAQARQTADDPVGKFVLYREARDLGAQYGETDGAVLIVDEMAKHFRIDVPALKSEVYAAAIKNAKTSEQQARLARNFLKLAEDSMRLDQYEAAQRAVDQAVALAKQAKDVSAVSRADAEGKEVAERKIGYEKIRRALEMLSRKPDDAGSNLQVGQHECFLKSTWDAGIPRLARGSDAALKAIAEQDFANPQDATGQIAAGDGWWNYSEKESNRGFRRAQRDRAGFWYQKAAVGAIGLLKTKIEKRLGELWAERTQGTWTDFMDPRLFCRFNKAGESETLLGKPGEAITLLPEGAQHGAVVSLKKWPASLYDGASVRMTFDAQKPASGCLLYGSWELVQLDSNVGFAAVLHRLLAGEEYFRDAVVEVGKKEVYEVMAVIHQGEYLILVDGKEVHRAPTNLTYLTSLGFQIQDGPVTFDQLKLRRKE